MKQRRVSYARLQRIQQQHQQLMVPPNHHFYDAEWSQSQSQMSCPQGYMSEHSNGNSNSAAGNYFGKWGGNANAYHHSSTTQQMQRFGRPSGWLRIRVRILANLPFSVYFGDNVTQSEHDVLRDSILVKLAQ